MTDQQSLLLAASETLGGTIRERLHRLPTKQKPNPSTAHPPVQNHCPRERTTIHPNCDGSHHRPPQKPRIRQHTDHCRSWMLSCCHFPPMSVNGHRPPDCSDVLSTCVPLVRVTLPDHIRPGPALHVTLREIPGQRTRRHLEPVNG